MGDEWVQLQKGWDNSHYECNYALTRVRICQKHSERNVWWGVPYSTVGGDNLSEGRWFDEYGYVAKSDEPTPTSMPGLRLLRRCTGGEVEHG